MGSYRHGGSLDAAVDGVLRAAEAAGAEVEKICLVDRRIEFCTNCRHCVRQLGPERGACVIDDDVDAILRELETADGLVLGAPVNFGDVNALTRCFLERMVGFAEWPRGQAAPNLRHTRLGTPAVLVTSSAAPGWMTRTCARPLRTLDRMAELLGARRVGSLVAGQADTHGAALSPRVRRRATRLGRRLTALAEPTAGRRRGRQR